MLYPRLDVGGGRASWTVSELGTIVRSQSPHLLSREVSGIWEPLTRNQCGPDRQEHE